ncbi:MAG: hypothetical protein IPL32_03785 [Chloracidobacterium sp.]|nr:hypothetical protein [Chloracidobacterium sp.]
MPTFRELFEQVPDAVADEVESSKNRWRDRLQAAMRKLTRFQLVADVPIKIDAGYPDSLSTLLSTPFTEEEFLAEIVSKYLFDIEALEYKGRAFAGLRGDLNVYRIGGALDQKLGDMVEGIDSTCSELRRIATQATVKEKLMAVRDDVMGVYTYVPTLHRAVSKPEIFLFWKVIGLAAGIMKISVEDLTVLVMTHELAHAYSHLGCDASGTFWSKGFAESDINVKEGIAQYYTWAIAKYLDEHHSAQFMPSYRSKISNQAGPYRVHEPWTEKYSLEVLRSALVHVRNATEYVTLVTFEDTLVTEQKAIRV